MVLARIYTETENAHGAIELLHKHWQSIFAQLKSSAQSTRLLERMVDAQLAAGHVDDAYRVAERMFVLGQDRKDTIQSATAAFHLARCLTQKREFTGALEYSKRSTELYRQVGRVRDSALAQFLTARTYRELGQPDLAVLSAKAATAEFSRIGDKNNKLECQEFLRTLTPSEIGSTGS